MTFSQKLASVLVAIAVVWPLIPIVNDRPIITVSDIRRLYSKQLAKMRFPSIGKAGDSSAETGSENNPDQRGTATIAESSDAPNRKNTTFGTPGFNGRQASLTSETVYFWKQDGIWNFSNLAPTREHETWILDPSENIVSLRSPELEKVAAMGNSETSTNPAAPKPNPTVEIPSGLPYSSIPQLIEQAKNVQNLANERGKALESIPY